MISVSKYTENITGFWGLFFVKGIKIYGPPKMFGVRIPYEFRLHLCTHTHTHTQGKEESRFVERGRIQEGAVLLMCC